MYRYVLIVGKLRCDDGKFINVEVQLHAKRLYVAPAGTRTDAALSLWLWLWLWPSLAVAVAAVWPSLEPWDSDRWRSPQPAASLCLIS